MPDEDAEAGPCFFPKMFECFEGPATLDAEPAAVGLFVALVRAPDFLVC